MNGKKIAFIMCVNDGLAYEECCAYLRHLEVPSGYETDLIAVTEAPSMAAGYNAGMQGSDAKYKVYLHQDVLIVNPHFISDLLEVFQADEGIGLVGMIGARRLGDAARAVVDWDTGKVLHNCTPSRLEFEPGEAAPYWEVEAVDGLLMATQEDVRWREELFDGWDYYDISQCMEFLRRGRKVVVPYQQEPWVWHDNTYSKMRDYYRYGERFTEEYRDLHPFVWQPVSEQMQEYNVLKERVREEIWGLIQAGRRTEVTALFCNPANRGYLHLKEFQILADIACLEEQNESPKRLWQEHRDARELLEELRKLKYRIKRVEFGLEQSGPAYEELAAAYSPYAVDVVREAYRFQ